MDKRKALSELLPMIMLVSLSTAVGVTGVAVIHSMQLENPIKMPVVEGGIIENLDQGAKEVSFTNNGEADVLLKVAFAQSWIVQDGTVLPNHIVDASGQSLSLAAPSPSLNGNQESGEDRWYYYKKVLPDSVSGIQDRNMEKLVQDVDFIDLLGIEDQRYQNAEYKFRSTVEIVQSSDDWNVSLKAVQRFFDRDILVTLDNWGNNKYGCSINWNVDSGKSQEVAVSKRLRVHTRLKNEKTAGPLTLAILLLPLTVTLACYSDVMTLASSLGTSHSGAATVEILDPESSLLPGETVIKKALLQNVGEMDLFLRVEVPPRESWCQKGQGSSPPVIPEKEAGYDTDHVIRHWNPGVWTDSGQAEENVDYTNMETELWLKSYTDKDGESYRYYRRVFPAGKTTDCILESISLSDEVSNDRCDADYSDKIYKLTFHAETVPIEEHDSALGVQSQWNMVVQEDSSGVLTWSQSSRIGERYRRTGE